MDATPIRCCGRPMSTIAVEQAASGLELHSCTTCGQHAWRSHGQAVDREQLLEVLTVQKPPRPRRPAAPAAQEPRTDLRTLLAGFQVHGSSS